MSSRCGLTDLPADTCSCRLHGDGAAHPEVMPYEAPGTPPRPRVSENRTSSRTAAPRPRDPLGRMLTRAPEVWAQLGEALTGHRDGGESEKVTGGGSSRPMPLQAQIAEHRHQLLHDLRWWVGHYCPHQGTDHLRAVGHSPGRMAALLLEVRADLDEDDTEALTGTLQDWLGRARMLSERPRLRSRLPLLPHADVPEDRSDLAEWERELLEAVDYTCAGLVHALIPADPDAGTLMLECDSCRQRWSPAELPHAGNVSASLSDAAQLTGTPLRTLQHWVRRGELDHADDGGRVSVRLGDVVRRRAVVQHG